MILLIYSFFLLYGDFVVVVFVECLLGNFIWLFYDIFRCWIYDGELLDFYLEFFVWEKFLNKEVVKGKVVGNVWEDKYEIVKDMILSIMIDDFV